MKKVFLLSVSILLFSFVFVPFYLSAQQNQDIAPDPECTVLLKRRVELKEEKLKKIEDAYRSGICRYFDYNVAKTAVVDAKIVLYRYTGERKELMTTLEEKLNWSKEQYRAVEAVYKVGATLSDQLIDAELAMIDAELELKQEKNLQTSIPPLNQKAGNKTATTDDTKSDSNGSRYVAGIARHFFMQGKHNESLQKIEEAVRLDPENANAYAYQGLGWAQFNLGDIEAAKKTWAKCLELDSKNAAALNGLGWAAWRETKKDDAVKHWEKAIAAAPNATAALSGLCLAYEEKGDKENAAKYYKMWLKVDPKNEEAQKGLERTE
ncbi:MAG: tetratricopeptide repeat protein [Planctomycetaceae bacterium]|jgi:tetratricopeptide (TPR) repeat protein|nr:tetratricopeptide repeat protein [Planctomycetaceae bacterium]